MSLKMVHDHNSEYEILIVTQAPRFQEQEYYNPYHYHNFVNVHSCRWYYSCFEVNYHHVDIVGNILCIAIDIH